MLRLIRNLLLAALVGWLSASVARAQNEGQQALDEATTKKIMAESLADLNEVVKLCEQALEKGLDETNTQFANNLLTGTLVQRGGLLTAAIFEKIPPDPRWPQLRGLAIKDLERAVKLEPKLGEAHYLIARLHSLPGGDRDRARKAVDQAVEHTKKEIAVQAKALVLRANLTEDAEKRLADYNEAIKIAPGDEEALRSRGLFYLVQSKFAEAEADFAAALKVDPDQPATHEARGVALLMLKKLDEAKESLSKAIELNPKASLPFLHRGRAKAEQKDLKGAIEDLDKAIELQPENVAALMFRARVHQQNGDQKAARADLDTALKSRPGLAPALELRAILAAGSGDLEQAINDFEELLKVAPDNAELLAQLGILHSAERKPQRAIERFTQALEVDKSMFPALRGRADAYLGIGKQAEAIADYEVALKLKPKDPGVLNNLAWVLATSPDDKLRDGKRSIELATEGCKVTDYKQAHILSTLAAAYAETGDWDKALEWSKKAVETGDESVLDQLKKELASYQEKKPWRELQTQEDKEPEKKED
jgi:tetratricopeptide (TPR) repeat protein